MRNHYTTLGLKPGASAQEIRAAYHREMRLHHPDRGAVDGGARAAELNEAYRCLSDNDRRHYYDRSHGLSDDPQYTFDPIRPSDARRRSWRKRAETSPASDEKPKMTFPLKWLVILAALLTIPFLYGIWINGY